MPPYSTSQNVKHKMMGDTQNIIVHKKMCDVHLHGDLRIDGDISGSFEGG